MYSHGQTLLTLSIALGSWPRLYALTSYRLAIGVHQDRRCLLVTGAVIIRNWRTVSPACINAIN